MSQLISINKSQLPIDNTGGRFRLRFIVLATLASVAPSLYAQESNILTAQNYRFNSQLLRHYSHGAPIDISRFNSTNAMEPGDYRTEFFVNEKSMGLHDIELRAINNDERNVQPCFNVTLLETMGVNLQKLPAEKIALLDQTAQRCIPITEIIDGASATFDMAEHRLDISIPQSLMTRIARGYVPPEYWDDGVTAARLRYNANIYRYDNNQTSQTQGFLGLSSGVNMGAWRLRHNGNLSYSSGEGTSYDSTQTYLQRHIEPLKGQLTIGETFSDGRLFNSYAFKGVQLATDNRMYPESQRGYAPTIRGIANTNARVQVRQNDHVIYETNVSPGAFEIDDLYPSGWYSGDLEVVVTEADGSVNTFIVPNAASINSLRPGVTYYSATMGRYDSDLLDQKPFFAQATLQHGLTNMFTLYGGALVSSDYYSILGGTALNTQLGAWGLDITYARAQNLPITGHKNGMHMRLSYAKQLTASDTTINLSMQHSSRDFLNFPDSVSVRDIEENKSSGLSYSKIDALRWYFQALINQNLRQGLGSLYFSGSTGDYWGGSGRNTQFQFGYNNHYKSIDYGVALSRQYAVSQQTWENRLMFTLRLPLGGGQKGPYFRTIVQYNTNNDALSAQQSVSGIAGSDNQFSYDMNAGYSRDETATKNFGGNFAYRAPSTTVGAGVSKVGEQTQTRLSMSGGVVGYAGGVVFSPDLGDTVAIIEATDAVGARVLNSSGLKIDADGHALFSNLSVFERNDIALDPRGLPLNIAIKSTTEKAIPTSGAVVRVQFETENKGRSAVLRTHFQDGKPLPFGADVLNAQNERVGIVAQAGKIIVHGLDANEGVLMIKWGENTSEQCSLNYVLPDQGRGAAQEELIVVDKPFNCI